MNEARVTQVTASRESLEAAGFVGFTAAVTVQLDRCERVPVERGVYVVLRDPEYPVQFRAKSPAGHYRGVDPTLPVEILSKRWIEGATVLYIGVAPGTGVRALLQQRIKRTVRFGGGADIAHPGGAALWQLEGSMQLRFAWKVLQEDPRPFAAALLAEFVARHGRAPFAQDDQEVVDE
ncbi:MAG: hypothetical protein ABIU54_03550 [Candidatus Eisenbacteria bacterium]